MKTFIVIFATLGIFALTISISICGLIAVIDETSIGRAIRDYILSKIVKEKPVDRGTPIKPTLTPMPKVKPPKEENKDE